MKLSKVDEFDIIKLKEEPKLASVACPVLYEFDGVDGNSYEFRYRSDVISLSTDKEILFKNILDESVWVSDWAEFCYYAYENKILIIDGEFGKDSWIEKLIN